MKRISELKSKTLAAKGFTLIELLVVIAILGILAVVLIIVINPLDKINSANDTGVIAAVAQFGRANDSYAASHNNTFVGGATVNAALTDLQTAGESKITAYTAPASYVVNYSSGPAACTTAAANCTQYVFWISALKALRYSSNPIYMWANGKGCFTSTVPTFASTCP